MILVQTLYLLKTLLLLLPVPVLVYTPLLTSLSSLLHSYLWMLLLPVGHEAVRERPILLPFPPPLSGEYVISSFDLFFFFFFFFFIEHSYS